MDMKVIPSFKHTLAVLGLVGLEVYSHRKRIKDIWSFSWVFMGFPYVFPRFSVNFPIGFPHAGVSSSSTGEASRDCCGQGVRNGGYPTIGGGAVGVITWL